MKNLLTLLFVFSIPGLSLIAQTISDFTSVEPTAQSTDFVIPSSHAFQYIIQHADPLTAGGNMPDYTDFTGYVPIAGSSTNGYLSINSETFPGGVTILDVNLEPVNRKWLVTASEKVNLTPVVRTAYNCSGTVTEWGTVISCEEVVANDGDGDGYKDFGWNLEIDPVTRTATQKLWAMGNFAHENVAIHANKRTVYQGADSNPGYIFKFVADVAEDLSSGKLYVYKGSKSGSGNWILLNNTTKAERNTTLNQCAAVGATIFKGVEDIEIGPDGKIYVAVSDECVVYRFDDSDPLTGTTVSNFEIYVGGTDYPIDYGTGLVPEPWGCGNDNMAFDGEGNLWVLQDGDKNYIWVIKKGHTQEQPKVELFGISPIGSEPTGITFTPDYKYLFMSIMHPNSTNNSTYQDDVFGRSVGFEKDIAIVIARNENFGPCNMEVDAGEDQTVYYGYPPAECATLTANIRGGTAPFSYQWSTGETTESITVCPTEETSFYTVIVTDDYGCMNGDDVKVCAVDVRCGRKLDKVEVCHFSGNIYGKFKTLCISKDAVEAHLAHGDFLGACDQENPCKENKTGRIESVNSSDSEMAITNDDWNVYPNPAKTYVEIDLSVLHGKTVELILLDASGREQWRFSTKNLNVPKIELTTSGSTPGFYHLSLSTTNQRLIKKLVITK